MIFVLLVRKIGKCSAAAKRPHAAATSAGSTPWVASFFILLGLRWTVGPFTCTFLSALSRLLTFLGNQTTWRHQWQYYIVCVQRRTIQETDLTTKTRKKRAGQHASSAQACSHSWRRFHKGPKSAKLHVCIKDVVAMMLVHDNVARMCELLKKYHQIDCHLQFQECFSGPKTQRKRMAGQLYSEDASAAHVSLGSLWKALEWLRKSLLELRQLPKGLVSFHRNTSYYTACPNKSFQIGNDVIAYIKMTAPKQETPKFDEVLGAVVRKTHIAINGMEPFLEMHARNQKVVSTLTTIDIN